MKKKPVIISVKELGGGRYAVTYESGVKRTYSKMTKPIAAFILDHTKRKQEKVKEYDSPYFKSLDAEIIFYLLQMSGEVRKNRLGITVSLYKDKAAARKWRDGLMKIVHPDNCRHPLAGQAATEVTRIYEQMTA